MSVLAIIPARSGSRGIPGKNMTKLNGKPLIEYTINFALSSKKIQRIFVSTDSKKIANFAQSMWITTPYLRPKKLSGDSTPMIDVVKHVLASLKKNENYIPKIICILQPTSPFRNKKMIDNAIFQLEHTKATSVVSVVKLKNHPFASFKIKKDYLIPFISEFQKYYQRQKYPELFYPTGGIYAFRNSTIEKYGNFYGPKIHPLIMEPELSLDIDEKFDLFISEMLLKFGKNKKF